MKRILIKLLLCVAVVLVALGVTGCSSCNKEEWSTTMTNPGAVLSNGGFVAETENYIYYINGYTSYGDDNTFGTPVKGALMAADKASLKTGEVKTEIVVPKLFVAEDYGAGVYIYDGYVYYGTPSTYKNNSGQIASGEMTFMRTNLTNGETEEFFTVTFLSYSYRYVQANGTVYLIYYNTPTFSLICYNTATKTEEVIAKTDGETKGSFETLDQYSFFSGEGINGNILMYSAKLYQEDYFEGAASSEDYTRQEETYNKIYLYQAGDVKKAGNEFRGTCILDGWADESMYSISAMGEDLCFFTKTDVDGEETVYGIKTSDLFACVSAENVQQKIEELWVEIDNPDYISGRFFDDDGDGVIDVYDPVYTIVSGADVTTETGETVASSDVFIVKTSVVGNISENYKRVAKVGTSSELIDIKTHGESVYGYYFNAMNCISRIKLQDVEGEDFYKEERISEDTVASVWYAPEFLTLDKGSDVEQQYVIYLDNNSAGGAYVKYVKIYDKATLSAEGVNPDTGIKVETEDSNDDGEIDVWYLTGHKFLGQIIDADTATTVVTKLNKIPATLEWELVNGEVVVDTTEIQEARAAYNLLSESAKSSFGSENLTKLESAEKAAEILTKLAKLDGIVNYEFVDATTQAYYRSVYDSVKDDMESIKNDDVVLGFIENNLKWAFYEKASDLFAPAE